MERESYPSIPIAADLNEANGLIVVLWREVRDIYHERDALRQENSALRQENGELQKRVERLEERLRTDSSNSSLPPSSDGVKNPGGKRRKKQRTGRKRGGQVGHEGRGRELLPPEKVNRVIECRPAEKCECGGQVQVEEDSPERRQQIELPKVEPDVTEFRVYSGVCMQCGRRHVATLPDGVPQGMLGPRAMAMAGELSGQYHLSKRAVTQVFDDFFGVKLSLGTISKNEARVSEALAKPVEEAHAYVQGQKAVHADETGHKMGDKRAWVWVGVTALVSVFMICFSRGAESARALLGTGFAGILNSDRWRAYNWVDPKRRQVCWSHLARDFERISERSGVAGWLGRELLEQTKKMWEAWHEFDAGTLDRSALQERMAPIRERVETLLTWGKGCPEHQTAGTCKEILKLKESLWTFVDTEGIAPTNNAAERAIRPYVLWRKCSYGTQSERGNQFVERIMTVSVTLRSQGRNVLDYLTQAITTYLNHVPQPSLLPQPTSIPPIASTGPPS